jgi:hypothetical protein
MAAIHSPRPANRGDMWLLQHRETRRIYVYTFFERRTGTNNRGTPEHILDLIQGGLLMTRQEAPGSRKFGR